MTNAASPKYSGGDGGSRTHAPLRTYRISSATSYDHLSTSPDLLLHWQDKIYYIPCPVTGQEKFSKLGCVNEPVPVSKPSPPFPGTCALFKIRKAEHICHKTFLPFINSRNSKYVSSIFFSFSDQQMSIIFHSIPEKIIVHQTPVPSSKDPQIRRRYFLAVRDLLI